MKKLFKIISAQTLNVEDLIPMNLERISWSFGNNTSTKKMQKQWELSAQNDDIIGRYVYDNNILGRYVSSRLSIRAVNHFLNWANKGFRQK